MRLPFAAMGDLLTMTRIRSLAPFGLSAIPLALLAVAGLTSFAPSRAQDAARGKKYALLIAVDRYEKRSLLPSLPFPSSTALGRVPFASFEIGEADAELS
jgi:hypothetical protein